MRRRPGPGGPGVWPAGVLPPGAAGHPGVVRRRQAQDRALRKPYRGGTRTYCVHCRWLCGDSCGFPWRRWYLLLCHLKGSPSRDRKSSRHVGGNYFLFQMPEGTLVMAGCRSMPSQLEHGGR